MAADQDDRVVRDSDERRRQDGGERLVVVAVVQQPQVGEEVDHLLLAEVAAARRTVRRQPSLRSADSYRSASVPAANRSTISPRAAAPLSTSSRTLRAIERASPSRQLVPAPCSLLVAHLQLDGMTEHRVGKLTRGSERLVVVPELLTEEVVDRSEHLGPRAVVAGQRQVLRGRLAAVAEDGDVGVPEAVDRLELVADEEHVRRAGPAAHQVDHVALQSVRVLELVDHDRAEAQLLELAHLVVVAQQVARVELEVFEVERRLALLRRRILDREQVQKLLQQLAVSGGELLERRLLQPVARRAELGGSVAGRRKIEIEQLFGIGAEREPGVRRRELGGRRVRIGGEAWRRRVAR